MASVFRMRISPMETFVQFNWKRRNISVLSQRNISMASKTGVRSIWFVLRRAKCWCNGNGSQSECNWNILNKLLLLDLYFISIFSLFEASKLCFLLALNSFIRSYRSIIMMNANIYIYITESLLLYFTYRVTPNTRHIPKHRQAQMNLLVHFCIEIFFSSINNDHQLNVADTDRRY